MYLISTMVLQTCLRMLSVLLSTVGVSDQAILADSTRPFSGTVFDGPIYKTDLKYSKDEDTVIDNSEVTVNHNIIL